MPRAFDSSRLPLSVRALVERALRDGRGHEAAIIALEEHLASGAERSPDALLALATLTYEEAAREMLHRLNTASARALSLVDEALAADAQPPEQLRRLRQRFAETLEREQARERRLRALLNDPSRARPTELMELAHQILMSGEDDQLAAELMAAAAEA